ncbi:MAG: hypothetical protein KAR35_02840 [Candidatus Heimdallarchaeota archaeon]|nr:hypothetical protein [Candidatus Heimdallarchaeota archaeon]MCK5048292.1 hypothetical protein [Candidatus Heimdallarchaeota archaeon]
MSFFKYIEASQGLAKLTALQVQLFNLTEEETNKLKTTFNDPSSYGLFEGGSIYSADIKSIPSQRVSEMIDYLKKIEIDKIKFVFCDFIEEVIPKILQFQVKIDKEGEIELTWINDQDKASSFSETIRKRWTILQKMK